MENKAYDELIGNLHAPYMEWMNSRSGMVSQRTFTAFVILACQTTLALTGNDTFGITTNCEMCRVSTPSIVDQLEGAGKTWKAATVDGDQQTEQHEAKAHSWVAGINETST